MALNYEQTAKKLLELVGGASNVSSAGCCMTRLRLVLKDEGKADDDAVNAVKGVKSVIKQGGQYQIVIGNEVSNVYNEFKKLGNFDGSREPEKAEGNIIQRMFAFVAGCMTPLLPALLGTGMVKVILTLLTTFAGLDTTTSTYVILNAMGDCFLLFFPVFLAYSAAKKIGGSPVLFMIVGAALVYPNLVTLMAGGSIELGTFMGFPSTSFFGIPVICATYTSSVLPILLMAPIMKAVENFADKVSPNVLKSFLKPLLFTIICVPIALIIIGPIGNVLGNGLSFILDNLYGACGWLAVAILAALMPFVVMTGMHYALIPLMMNSLSGAGFDALVLISMFCSNLAQGGAAFGVAVKSKDTEVKSEAVASGISALVAGVTEPALYGTNMRFRTPMIGACIGAGVSGLFSGLVHLVAYVYGGSPSLLSLVTFIGGDTPMRGVFFGVIAAVITLALSFFITLFVFKEEGNAAQTGENDGADLMEETETQEEQEEKKVSTAKSLIKKMHVKAPMTGEVVALKDVPDAVFSSGMLGEGAAILPSEGKVVAPCDGVISATMDSGHAVGITSSDGMELLIHVGLNTVELGGKYFKYHISQGDQVKEGDLLMEFDLEAISAAGYQLHTPVIISNTDDYVSIKAAEPGAVRAGDDFMTVV